MASSIEKMLAKVPSDYDKREGSVFYDTLKPASMVIDAVRQEIAESLKLRFASTSSGTYLDKIASDVGITRKPAVKAQGEVTISGENGTVIEAGTKVASDTLVFSTIEEATIESGSVRVRIMADVAGSQGNVPPSAINSFPVTISGLNTVTNEQELRGGQEEETDEALRERYFIKVREPATSGNVYHYRRWALEVIGIGGVKVFPLHNGPGTVKLIIVDTKMQQASKDLIEAVKAHIEQVKPIGATVEVVSATNKEISVSAKVKILPSTTLSKVQSAFSTALKDYFRCVSFDLDYVSLAKTGNILLSVEGVTDYTELKLNASGANVSLEETEIPVVSSVAIEGMK